MQVSDGRCFRLWGRGEWMDFYCTVDIAYSSTVRAELPANWSGEGTEVFRDAELVPEVGESGESVAIRLGGRTIGHLGPEYTAAWAPVVRRVIASGLIPTVPCRLYVYENDTYSGKRTTGRVELSLGDPATALPVNDPPAVPYTVLPTSSVVQVTKEDQHFDALHTLMPSGGHAVFIATLHERPAQGANKPVVEVRINDQCVGQLTPQTSARYLPLIRHFHRRGLVPACWSDVKASALAAEVRIAAVKSAEVPAEVLDGDPLTIPPLVPPRANPAEYDLSAMGAAIAPIPAPVPPSLAEPPDGAIIRFVLGDYYFFVAYRQGPMWLTTSTSDDNTVKQMMFWRDLSPLLSAFDYASAMDWVDPGGDHRVREQGAVVCFALTAESVHLADIAAINISDSGDRGGDWYTTFADEDGDFWSDGYSITLPDLARRASHMRVVTGWSRFELPAG